MRQMDGYDKVQAQDGNFERLPAGGYVCAIKSARVEASKNGNDLLIVAFDIIEGDHQGHFQKDFDRRKGAQRPGYANEAKWGGVYRQLLCGKDGLPNPFFKGMMVAIENSNPGYKWDWNEGALKGKRIGFVFGDEEYLSQKGDVRTIAKPRWPRSVDEIRKGVTPPPLKTLSGASGAATTGSTMNGFTQVDDEVLPF